MIQVLGVLDILAGIWLVLLNYDLGGTSIGGLLAGYLFIKGIFFRDNVMSYVDIVCGIFIILLMFGMHTKLIYLIPAIYLVQKGIMSFF
ncbi:MAG: hypothetical protein KAT43_01630 [Nanoarchaeota archaeon]|nr:hypothetical protein [Nanoarchaeota archaeon]